MKITVITCPFGALPPLAVGAVEKLFHLLAGEWVRAGYRVCFVCAGGGDNPQIEYRRLRRYDRTGSTKWDLFWDLLYSFKAIFKCPQTDILLCNTFWSPVLAPLVRWKYKKLVYGVHRFPKRQYFLYPFVHKFICVSTVVADALKKQVAAERVCVVVNPIDVEVFKQAPRQIVRGRIVYAGRVHPLKGLACLAKACGQLYQRSLCSELVLAGPWELDKGGGGESFVEDLKRSAGGCPVVLKGAVSDSAELAEIERSAEVFVYPSEDAMGEACPVAPMEAMALGVPVVLSDLACYKDYAQDGRNVTMFAKGDFDDLANKLESVFLHSILYKEIGMRSAVDMGAFSAEQVCKRYLDQFRL